MIDCPECNGAGQIATSYREAAPKKTVPQKKERSHFLNMAKAWASAVADFLGEYGGFLLVLTILVAILYIAFNGIRADIKARDLKAIEDAKHGYFIAQYDEANTVQRCWITPSKDEVVLVGKGAYVWVYDMDNPGGIPTSIGISTPSKCVRIQ
jgi:hypothetical protein